MPAWYAVRALSLFNDIRSIQALIKALRHRDPLVAFDAILSLGKIGDERGIKPLIEIYWDGGFMQQRDLYPTQEDARLAIVAWLASIIGLKPGDEGFPTSTKPTELARLVCICEHGRQEHKCHSCEVCSDIILRCSQMA
jgi:hypothetical protein